MLPARRKAILNPRVMSDADWDAVVGKHDSVIDDVITTLADVPNNGFNPGVTIPLHNVQWDMPPDLGTLRSIWDFRNSIINWRLNLGHHIQAYIHMRNSTMDVPLNHMSVAQENGPALGGTGMSVYGLDIKSRIDAIWPGDGQTVGNSSVVDLTRIKPTGYVSWIGFPLAPGNIPVTVKGLAGTTGEVLDEALLPTVGFVQPNHVYTAGELISTDRNCLYQVSTGGTSGSGTLADGRAWYRAWHGGDSGSPPQVMFKDLPSNDTTQPFSDGPNTLKLAFIGRVTHADGMQIIRAGSVDITRTKIFGYPNSCIIIQGSARSYDNGEPPTGPVRVYNCDLRASGYFTTSLGQWLYVNTNSRDPDNPTRCAGRWRRSSGGVWSLWSTPWLGRPEGVSIINNLFRPRDTDGAQPFYPTNRVVFAHGSTGDWPIYVRSEADRQAGYARQWSSPGVIDPAVLEERFQRGVWPGAVDARSWIVFADNVDEAGNIIYPIDRTGTGFDAQGYYTGA
jgi:hypothetical protein